jgi:hypothetical protein
LRLPYYQAANVARHHNPGLAFHYRELIVERWQHPHVGQLRHHQKTGHPNVAVLHSGQPYQLRDLEDNSLDWATATSIAASFTVPDDHAAELEPPPPSEADLSS